mmetsp:Transcript_269/g.399  ORF Transcript_269/g.399 Transcript_269/m.399 type:complete len:97 (-) Transcript_269:702-992(-)
MRHGPIPQPHRKPLLFASLIVFTMLRNIHRRQFVKLNFRILHNPPFTGMVGQTIFHNMLFRQKLKWPVQIDFAATVIMWLSPCPKLTRHRVKIHRS